VSGTAAALAALPVILVGLPAALLLGVAVLRARWLAVGLVPLSFPVGLREVPDLPVRLVQVTVLAAVALTWLRRGVVPRSVPALPSVGRSPVLLAAGATVLTALLASVVAADPAVALRLDVDYLFGLALAGTVMLVAPDRAALRALLGTISVGGGVVCAGAVVTASPLTPYLHDTVVQNRATGIFGQPNELGLLAAVVALVSLAWLLSLPQRPLRLVALASLAVAAGALVLSLSRGAWIGAVLGMAVLLTLVPQARRRLAAGIGAVAVAAVVAGALLPGRSALAVAGARAATLVTATRNPYDLRPQIWQEALRQIDAHPWLGVGPGGYPVLAAEQPTAVHVAAPTHAHSLLLTVLAEQGLLGLLGLLAVVLVGVLSTVRAARSPAARRPDAGPGLALLAGPASGLAVVLGQGAVDYPLRNPVLEVLVWLLVGLLAAACRAVRTPVTAGATGRRPSPAAWSWFAPPATGSWPAGVPPRGAGQRSRPARPPVARGPPMRRRPARPVRYPRRPAPPGSPWPVRPAPASASGCRAAGRSAGSAGRRRGHRVRRTSTAG
jgi:O-antigen ligase